MKQAVQPWVFAGVLIFTLGCGAHQGKQDVEPPRQELAHSPFSISVVPTSSQEEPYGRGISMAKKSPDYFYVVLTNISMEPQAAFETRNSWGYLAVSFEVETADGRKFAISRKPQIFTVNFPSTFVIPPGEHMVYPISLDDKWTAVPSLPLADERAIPITIKAVYEVRSTPEATKGKVCTGRLESSSYHFKFRHW